MRSHSLKCGLALGILAAGLFAAAPAAKFSRLTVKLHGGYNDMSAGDVNSGLRYYFDILDLYSAEGLGTVTGGYTPLHGGINVGGDIIYQLSSNFGIGLGFGYMRSSANSLGTWTNEDETVTLTAEGRLTGMPIRLGAFFTAPLSKKVKLITDVGVDYFIGVKLYGMQGLDWTEADWTHMILEGSKRSGLDIGFHGNLGFEYLLTPKLGFFVEAAAQYANLKNFESVTGTQEADEGTDSTEGKLYIGSQVEGGQSMSMFTIVEPEGTPPSSVFREPKIDLSGLALRAGFRIRF
jgi:hypothetical protein